MPRTCRPRSCSLPGAELPFFRVQAQRIDAPSLRDGWSRRHVVTHLSYQAPAMALALKGIREGLTEEEEAEWRPDAMLAATLPVRALR